ncbi:MAG: ABC transporter ATP-binding protein [Candidatus Marinimicrobia bacterium]|nr:ABC transporter ATP-binding protein [Candidatus Neomarinimicrobiota bacterium]
MSLLTVENLSVINSPSGRSISILKNISFSLNSGETLAVIGETGSGKSMLCKSIIGLLPPGFSCSGNIWYTSSDNIKTSIITAEESDLLNIRGREIGMVFQEAVASLNPVVRCGNQITDVLSIESKIDKNKAKKQARKLLETVGLSEPERIFHAYPHQLSGGMAQRVVLALALAGEPQLLIADEPSSSLDSTSKKYYLNLLNQFKQENNLTLILVTHDVDEALSFSDNILVLYAGCMTEYGRTGDIQKTPAHPYTKALLDIARALKENDSPTPIPGEIPSLTNPPSGCRFHPRCPKAQDICRLKEPSYICISDNHYVRCFFPAETI